MRFCELSQLDSKRVFLTEIPPGAIPVFDRTDQSKPVHIMCKSKSGKKKYSRSQGQTETYVAKDLTVKSIKLGEQALVPMHDVFVDSLKEVIQDLLDKFPNEKVYVAVEHAALQDEIVEVAIASCEAELI